MRNHDVLVNFAKLCCVFAGDVRLDGRMYEMLLKNDLRGLFDTPHGIMLPRKASLEAYQFFIAARLVEKLQELRIDTEQWPPKLASFARRYNDPTHSLDNLRYLFPFDKDCKFPCVIAV